MYPKSWWWQPDMDFLAAILNALQWGNWQRGGGKGDKPKPVKRPRDPSKKIPKSGKELEQLKQVAKRRAVQRGD